MNHDQELRHTLSTYHLKQQELVNFLYNRFTVGMIFTLIVALVASALASYELSIQGKAHWALVWLSGLILIQYFRYRLKQNMTLPGMRITRVIISGNSVLSSVFIWWRSGRAWARFC